MTAALNLTTCLRLAVSLRVTEIAAMGRDAGLAHLCSSRGTDVDTLTGRADVMLYGQDKAPKAETFTALARSVAILATSPGGVRGFGLLWCAWHSPGGTPARGVQLCRWCLAEEMFQEEFRIGFPRPPGEGLLDAVRDLTGTADPYRSAGDVGAAYGSLIPPPAAVRKGLGSFYTPPDLVALVLDEALDPLLDEAEKAADPAAALLALTVCDPACGAGAFLTAAARRITARLSTVRTGGPDSDPAALRDVIAACVFGVDLDPVMVDVTRLVLSLLAWRPGHPVVFLDPHIKVGNALLGTTPALFAGGIPDAAFVPLTGDDPRYAAALRRRNKAERERIRTEVLVDESAGS